MLQPQQHHARARKQLMAHLASAGIADADVLAAMDHVPREVFVPEAQELHAYDDTALAIAAGQTISQPYIVALMLQLAQITPRSRVLEVGAGSGYAAAVMSRIAQHVFAMERQIELVEMARANLAAAGCSNVTVVAGDGTVGLPAHAPFDAIVVSAGGSVPSALRQQLAPGGRLVIPEGIGDRQVLTRIRRGMDGSYHEDRHGLVSFVPLIADDHH